MATTQIKQRGTGEPGNAGFTLIELLVVIAIIAILAALLMPALERARDAAQDVVCKNHMRQLGIGCQLYAEAYGGLPQLTRMYSGDPIEYMTIHKTRYYWLLMSEGFAPNVYRPDWYPQLGYDHFHAGGRPAGTSAFTSRALSRKW